MRRRGASGPYLMMALANAGLRTCARLARAALMVSVLAGVVAAGVALIGLLFGPGWDVWAATQSFAIAVVAVSLPFIVMVAVHRPRNQAFGQSASPAFARPDYRRVWASERRVAVAAVLAAAATLGVLADRPTGAIAVALVIGWSLAVAGTLVGVVIAWLCAAVLLWFAPDQDVLSWVGWALAIALSPIAAALVVGLAHGIGNAVAGRPPRLPQDPLTRIALLKDRARRFDRNPTERYQFADTLTNLGGVYASLERYEEAEPIMNQAIAEWSHVVTISSPEMSHAKRGHEIVQGVLSSRNTATSLGGSADDAPSTVADPLMQGASGLTVPMAIRVSAEAALSGEGDAIYEHEAVHDRLLKTTPFGHVEHALALFTDDTFPEGPVKSRALDLRQRLHDASWSVQEGAATYVGSRCSADQDFGDVDQNYQRAAAQFAWLNERAGLTDFERCEAAKYLARRALQAPLLQQWFLDNLWEAENLQIHLDRGENRPDARIQKVMKSARRQSDTEIARGVEAQLRGNPFELEWPLRGLDIPLCTVDGHPTSLIELFSRIAANANRPGLSATTQSALEDMTTLPPIPYLGPSAASLVVTSTAAERVLEVPPGDMQRVCSESALVMIAANPLGVAIPSRTGLDGWPRMLPSGQADVTAMQPGQSFMCRIPMQDLADVIVRLPDGVSVGVYSLGYDFDAGDYFFVPVLGGRRHFVLVQSPWIEVAPMIGMRTEGRDGFRLLAAGAESTDSGLGFILLRAKRPEAPLIAIPTVRAAAGELVSGIVQMLLPARVESVEHLADLDPDWALGMGLLHLTASMLGIYHRAVEVRGE